ncbi:MAG: DNA polymerase III subunit alpha, partial [Oscillospiraceae bacterium]
NLIKIVSAAWTEGFYVKPRIDRELLEKYHEGIIALSACIAGEVPRLLLQNDYEKAKQTALWYNDLFGQGNYYIEIQNHGIREQLEVLPKLIKLARETNIPLVATNDVHYVKKEDEKIQKVLICIQTNHTINEDTGLDFQTDDFYLKSENEMRELFSDVQDAIDNTGIIADMCNFDFEFGKTKLPYFYLPPNVDRYEYFKGQCYKGLKIRYGDNPSAVYTERLDYELSVIKNMGYIDYFLIVADFIDYAKSKDIPVGPGRGSGAGSIAAYCMGITDVDPIKYNLLFERFLNPERVSMPDFDIDFCYVRREEVIEYVIKKYGADHVSQIVTFGTMAARAAIRDVGRALGLSYSTVDLVAKLIPREIGITIEKALLKVPELNELYKKDEIVRELIDTAKSVEGMPRHASKHAAGVVITDKPVSEYVPLAKNDDSVVTQFTMTTIEELGLLKMDFLGLRTLTVISDAQKMIRKKEKDFDIEKISIDDEKTYEMFSKGLTYGVFQCESAGLRNVLMKLKPENLEDIIAVISLYRPGPMDSIDTYIANRNNPQNIKYKTPMLKEILDVTYGCMVYQEQVMQIFRTLAGYSLGRADIVRRAMSKKKHKVMEQEREYFINGLINPDGSVACEGAVKRGVSKDVANSIFDDMTSFASYAFNKSHSAAYALVAYRTAYLKCHYPAEFMAALLTSVIDDFSKISAYIADCERMKIKVLSPSVNKSFNGFTPQDNSIRFGLLAIKNLGNGFIETIISERDENGEYKSFYDFCKRTYGKDFNRRAVEGLIKSGALDGFSLNRREMLINLNIISADLEIEKRNNVDGQLGLFDIMNDADASSEPNYTHCEEMPKLELLSLEKEITGLYMSGHPMGEYVKIAESINATRVVDLLDAENDLLSSYKDGTTVKVLGIITSVKKKITKNDTTMAFFTIEDIYGSIEVIAFPKIYQTYGNSIITGSVLLIRGRLSLRDDESAKIVLDTIEKCPTKIVEKKPKPKKGLFIRLPQNTD